MPCAVAGGGESALESAENLRAQPNKKLSILTWNIADQQELFKTEWAEFKAADAVC